ncbi:MAG: Mur ligase domain-containing protein, partial [Chthoniobacteraceae bacterium]
MKLDTLLSQIPTVLVDGPPDADITGIAYDSRRVQPGFLFVALMGEHVSGAQFVEQAVEKGAVPGVTEKGVAKTAATHGVGGDTRKALAQIAA